MADRKPVVVFALIITFTFCSFRAHSQEAETVADSTAKITFWSKMFKGNIDRTYEKKFDVSAVASPSYTREASFGIGSMISGLYRLDRTDSLMPPSNVNIAANFSVNGFMSVSLKGNNYFRGNRTRLSYEIKANSQKRDFWGISYAATNDNPKVDLTRRQIIFNTDYVYNLVDAFYAGGTLDFLYSQAHKIEDISYLEGEKKNYSNLGIGLTLQYDTRDFIPNPRRGINLMLRGVVFPEPFGNTGNTLLRGTFNANYYQPVWSGGLLAFDLYGQFNSKKTPWARKEELGGMTRMRGYYEGRYIDNNIVSGQVELRQHIWRRVGGVVWAGGGTVFPEFKAFKHSDILPTYGIGFRWEFKHNVNIRLDYGFGKGTSGFVMNVGEAF